MRRVGLGLGLGEKELVRMDCCNNGEKHCLPRRTGDREPADDDVDDVMTCSGSVNERGRFTSVIIAFDSWSP